MSPRAATARDRVGAALARAAHRAPTAASWPIVRVAAAGGELRPLAASDPAAKALAASAEAVLSATQHGSRR
jgi:hypothetical protein